MVHLSEDTNCYATTAQRDLLCQLAEYPLVRDSFFLIDDPPTAAYQMEEGIRFLQGHTQLLPRLKRALDLKEMCAFFESASKLIYAKGSKK